MHVGSDVRSTAPCGPRRETDPEPRRTCWRDRDRNSFVTEWQDGEGIAGEELSATFAALRIDVGGEPLTKVLDNRAATIRDSIFVPLYPIAEWLVSNWWFLAHEPENPAKKRTPAFNRRHSLRTSADGYALPDLTMTHVWGLNDSPLDCWFVCLDQNRFSELGSGNSRY